MGRLVVLADVGLELDDPGNPWRPAPGGIVDGAVVPDQPAAEQRPAKLQGRQREDVASACPYRVLTGT
jgi:hypothetical protein